MDPILKYDLDDSGSLWLDPTRHERVYIPAGPPPEPCITACPVHNHIPVALLAIEQGLFQVESEATGRTTLEGVYAAGDDVHGAELIVTAIAAGRDAARAMDDYLRTLPK